MHTISRVSCQIFALALVLLPTCRGAYYKAMEEFGFHKRDLLVRQVQAARDEQEAAKEEFVSALDKFRQVVQFEGGDLEEKYKVLNAAYERSAAQADAVRKRIRSVEDVAEALYREWQKELEEYQDQELRRASEVTMHQTRQRYEQLISAMKQAEGRMDPVLRTLHDQVLFLKHNLNARAIAALEGTVGELQTDVSRLVEELERSIAEANAFIQALGIE